MIPTELLKKEVQDLREKLSKLETELRERDSLQLMYINKRGKHTFVLQSKDQSSNLLCNGWRHMNFQELKNILANYDIQ